MRLHPLHKYGERCAYESVMDFPTSSINHTKRAHTPKPLSFFPISDPYIYTCRESGFFLLPDRKWTCYVCRLSRADFSLIYRITVGKSLPFGWEIFFFCFFLSIYLLYLLFLRNLFIIKITSLGFLGRNSVFFYRTRGFF